MLQAAQIVCTLVGHKGRVNSVRWLSTGKNVHKARFSVFRQHVEATRRLIVAHGLQMHGSMDLFCSQERQTTLSLYGCGTKADQKSIALQPNWRYIIKLNSYESTNNPSQGLMAIHGLTN